MPEVAGARRHAVAGGEASITPSFRRCRASARRCQQNLADLLRRPVPKYSYEQLAVTPQEALRLSELGHGAENQIDSSMLMNSGLEVIERALPLQRGCSDIWVDSSAERDSFDG